MPVVGGVAQRGDKVAAALQAAVRAAVSGDHAAVKDGAVARDAGGADMGAADIDADGVAGHGVSGAACAAR